MLRDRECNMRKYKEVTSFGVMKSSLHLICIEIIKSLYEDITYE